MSKLEMMELLLPGLAADEIEVCIDQMEDIPEVLSLNCRRALTELDAKAREAEELEKIRKKT